MISAPATATDVAWILGLLQAGDSYYPTGSYAHSFGLEGLVQERVVHDRSSLQQHLQLSVMPALRHVELPLAALGWRAFADLDWDALRELSILSSATKTAREARVAAENIGRQRAELIARLHPSPLPHEYLQRADAGGWPFSSALSAALEGRVLGAPLDAVLAGLAYSSIAAVLAAAMKILRLGQNAAQSLLTETLADVPAAIAAARDVRREDIGWFNPWLDIAAARHESADARMFIS